MTEVQKKPFVSFSESYNITGTRVGEAFEEMLKRIDSRFMLSSAIGSTPYGPHETDSYGILLDDRAEKSWFFPRKRYLRRKVAILWLYNVGRKATRKKWVLEIYGRDQVQYFKVLADELSSKFKVSIHICLKSEEMRYEFQE